MIRSILLTCFLVACFGVLTSSAIAQPERERHPVADIDQEVPAGFERQALELGGLILRPIGWKYESRELGQTIVCKMWEPMPDGESGFDTSFTIDIVTNIAEAKMSPSEFAASYIEGLKEKGKVVKIDKPQTTNGLIQSGIMLDQRLKITATEKDYRIRRVLIADDKSGLLFVLTFGTLVSKWEDYEPTFRVMTKELKLFDLRKMTESDK